MIRPPTDGRERAGNARLRKGKPNQTVPVPVLLRNARDGAARTS